MIKYKSMKFSEIDRIESMWEELICFLQERSVNFKVEYENKTFKERMLPFYKKIKNGYFRLLIAVDNGEDIAYCLSSINESSIGEIDSLYINPKYRKQGIGEYLVHDAFEFFDQHNTIEDVVMASEGNEAVLEFYKKQGFSLRYYTLKRKK